jgi:hypothetical protein
MEGLLLAESFDSVPSTYTDHSFMPLCLSITNQFDECYESKVAIQVERIPARIQPRADRRSTLYDGAVDAPGRLALPVDVHEVGQPVIRNSDCRMQAKAKLKAPWARPAREVSP